MTAMLLRIPFSFLIFLLACETTLVHFFNAGTCQLTDDP